MKIENARIIIRDGRSAPVITVGGRLFDIETKSSLLDLGIAAMSPLNGQLEDDYEAPVEHTTTLPADPANGRMEESTLDHFTTAAEVVALARKFFALAVAGADEEGPL